MKQEIIIFHAKPWSMIDENTNQRREGVSCQYTMTNTLKPFVDSDIPEYGYAITKESLSIENGNKLAAVPGVYEADFMLKASNGKNVLVIKDLRFLDALIPDDLADKKK